MKLFKCLFLLFLISSISTSHQLVINSNNTDETPSTINQLNSSSNLGLNQTLTTQISPIQAISTQIINETLAFDLPTTTTTSTQVSLTNELIQDLSINQTTEKNHEIKLFLDF